MPTLDRAVSNVAWSADGQNISFLLQDDRTNHVATVPAENPNGTSQRKSTGRRVICALSPGKDGNFAVLATSPTQFTEVYALEGGEPAAADEAQRHARRANCSWRRPRTSSRRARTAPRCTA